MIFHEEVFLDYVEVVYDDFDHPVYDAAYGNNKKITKKNKNKKKNKNENEKKETIIVELNRSFQDYNEKSTGYNNSKSLS